MGKSTNHFRQDCFWATTELNTKTNLMLPTMSVTDWFVKHLGYNFAL